jgi:hypothetical protein
MPSELALFEPRGDWNETDTPQVNAGIDRPIRTA